MSVTFSGWKAVEERKSLSTNQEPEKGHLYTMYHGTHLQNARAIITHGFKQSKDGLLGPGVYISRNVEKAKCYPLGLDKKDKVVFRLKVRVGKVKKIDCDNHPLQKNWHQSGYDCAWVPPNSGINTIKSGREEDCVWDPSRITIVDVACCMDPAVRRDLRRLIKSNRKTGGECDKCHQGIGTSSHPIQTCWECGKVVCPFQLKHTCKQG